MVSVAQRWVKGGGLVREHHPIVHDIVIYGGLLFFADMALGRYGLKSHRGKGRDKNWWAFESMGKGNRRTKER
jgi:hypothetical protein